jgi:hypothetical protein
MRGGDIAGIRRWSARGQHTQNARMQECTKAGMHEGNDASSDANEDVGDEDEQQDQEPELLRLGQHFSNARMHQCTNAFVH